MNREHYLAVMMGMVGAFGDGGLQRPKMKTWNWEERISQRMKAEVDKEKTKRREQKKRVRKNKRGF